MVLEKIAKKDYDGLDELLKHKIVDANMHVNQLGMTSLHVVCSIISEKTQWMIHVLVKHGANPNLQDIHGRTCLHFAAAQGNINAFTFLLRHFNHKAPFQLNLNLRTVGGETALFKAVQNLQVECV
mgnify:CR=1 FL=1